MGGDSDDDDDDEEEDDEEEEEEEVKPPAKTKDSEYRRDTVAPGNNTVAREYC